MLVVKQPNGEPQVYVQIQLEQCYYTPFFELNFHGSTAIITLSILLVIMAVGFLFYAYLKKRFVSQPQINDPGGNICLKNGLFCPDLVYGCQFLVLLNES